MKKALALSFFTQLYVSLIGFILMPVYLHYLGAEAFGLVGFYTTLQAWLQILDMGLTPVLSREMSRFRAGNLQSKQIATRLRTLEMVQGIIALLAIALLWIYSHWISETWFSVADLPQKDVAVCITLLGIAAALRWLTGIYRAALVGLEEQYWVSGLLAVFTTLRFAGAVPLLMYVSASPVHFFAFQAGVGGFELIVFAATVHCSVPGTISAKPNVRVLIAMLPMIGTMALLSAIWIAVTQIDKLVLSGILPLKDYGYFMIAVMAASGVLVFVPPLHQVVQPRMTILAECREEEKLMELYRLVSQLAVVIFVSFGGALAFFAEPILRIWTGSMDVSRTTVPVLFWYGLANAVVGVLVLPYMLQFARGQLRLHILGNLITLAILIPALVITAKLWGGAAAGQVFFTSNLLFLLFWVPLVHQRFLPMMRWKLYLYDTLFLGTLIMGWFAVSAYALPNSVHIFQELGWISVSVLVAIILGVVFGDRLRRFVFCLIFEEKK